MLKATLLFATLGMLGGTDAIFFSSLPSQLERTAMDTLIINATIADVTENSTLSWMVRDERVANVSVVVMGNTTTLENMKTSNDSLYGVTFELSGTDVDTSLTFKNLDLTFDGAEIRLTDGTASSNASTIMVKASTVIETTMTHATETGAPTSAAATPSPAAGAPTSAAATPSSVIGSSISPTTMQPDTTTEMSWSYCEFAGAWGENCTKICGGGCPGSGMTRYCDPVTGKCRNPSTGEQNVSCKTGYKGELCNEPVCDKVNCNGGKCLAPNYCGLCPVHFAQMKVILGEDVGIACRNIRLDGFLKGSLTALAVLAVIVISLKLASKWYISTKIKET